MFLLFLCLRLVLCGDALLDKLEEHCAKLEHLLVEYVYAFHLYFGVELVCFLLLQLIQVIYRSFLFQDFKQVGFCLGIGIGSKLYNGFDSYRYTSFVLLMGFDQERIHIRALIWNTVGSQMRSGFTDPFMDFLGHLNHEFVDVSNHLIYLHLHILKVQLCPLLKDLVLIFLHDIP